MTEKQIKRKIYAGWMGKNIGGTLGGPLEGQMKLLDIHGYTQTFVSPSENDDLDLQLVSLHCIEQYGGNVDTTQLSKEWLQHVHFPFDEYGHSLTNIRRGIGTPLSGFYNNFFIDCMGSPIRSEIWAMICAGMPELAAFYAYQDASVDHAGGEGVYGEIFFAVLESMAFFSCDIPDLIDKALSYLPESSIVRKAVKHLIQCHHSGLSWIEARKSIIDNYANDNFTYAPVNVAFTLMGLLYETGFTKQLLMTTNCGYDTDCTAATLGALLGILYGPGYIDAYWTKPLGSNILTSRAIFGFNLPKTINELTMRTLDARKLILCLYKQQHNNSAFIIPYIHDREIYRIPEGSLKDYDLYIEIFRDDACPTIAPMATKSVKLLITNLRTVLYTLDIVLLMPEGFISPEKRNILIKAGETTEQIFQVTAPIHKSCLWRGEFLLTEYINGNRWTSHRVPITFLPTIDFSVSLHNKTTKLYCKTNCINFDWVQEDVVPIITLQTTIVAYETSKATIKFAFAKPIEVLLDGKQIILSMERTVVIPAYHRADPRKCADVCLTAGEHLLTIQLYEVTKEDKLYLFVVDRTAYWSYKLDFLYMIK